MSRRVLAVSAALLLSVSLSTAQSWAESKSDKAVSKPDKTVEQLEKEVKIEYLQSERDKARAARAKARAERVKAEAECLWSQVSKIKAMLELKELQEFARYKGMGEKK